MKLRQRLVMSAMIIIFIALLITGSLSTLLINRQFSTYVTTTHENNLKELSSEIVHVLTADTENDFSEISLFAASKNYYVLVSDENGNIVFQTQSTGTHHMMGHRRGNGMNSNGVLAGLDVFTQSVQSQDGTLYTVTIGYTAEDKSTEDVVRFKTTMYKSIGMAMVFSLLLGLFLSSRLAKPISEDIENVSEVAKAIAQGENKRRLPEKAYISEIEQLNRAMNQMAKTLENQENLRKELVETVSHEVKTPLTILQSQVESFLDGIFKPDKQKLTRCHEEIVRLGGLIERIEELNELSAERYVLNVSQFDLVEEIQNVIQILKPQFLKKQIQIDFTFHAACPITLDRYKFRQILYNLLSNAYKFSSSQTTVVVDLSCHASEFRLEIINKGLVIAPENFEKIFEPHYRDKGSDAFDPHGKGLGLNIVRSLTEFMNGQVKVQKSDTQSTIFVLTMPFKQ